MDDILRAASECSSDPFCHKRHNPHWRPQFAGCPYCHINYQVIGKAETFADDVKYIVLKQNLTSLIPLEDTKKINHATFSEAKKTDYMAQLNINQIKGLYTYYQRDFELFDYDITVSMLYKG